MFKIVFTGSRSFRTADETKDVQKAIDDRLAELDKIFEGEDLLCIIGGANGVDTWVKFACDRHDIPTHIEPVESWYTPDGEFNKAAGHQRNARMLDMEPDMVIAFWDGYSPGTEGCMEEAERRGIEVEIHTFGAHKI